MHTLSILTTLLALGVTLATVDYCKDWTLCHRVRCAYKANCTDAEYPYPVYGECGCCQYCSKTPRIGPCGECGKDVVCRTEEPKCEGENQTVTLDYCGCCRTCKTIVELDGECESNLQKPSSTVCAVGLQCVDNKCVQRE